ncbi:MAG: hypothetical protein KatS3mg005_3058 [Bryobacteraceae bacterium]|nr:MAG: hypothetical protein KatS3mg005_3058 [Bryobacteraceae bacterium]
MIPAAGGLWLAAQTTQQIQLSSVRLDARPLTVQYEERPIVPGKAPVIGSKRTFAIRGDLSTVTDTIIYFTNGNGVSSHVREIAFSSGDRLRIDERLSLVTAIRTSVVFSEQLPLLTTRSNCTDDFTGQRQRSFSTRAEKLLGYSFVAETRQAGPRRIKTWASPELGCVELRRVAEFLDASGRVTDTSELVAVSVIPGEPDAKLFSVPLHFEHVSYSEQLVRAAQAAGRTPSEEELAGLRRQDAIWERQRITDLATVGKTPRRVLSSAK